MQLELGGTVGGQTWTALSDKEFLKAVAWKRGAVPELAQAAKKGDVSTFVAALVSHWQPDDETPTLLCRAIWSLPAFVVSPRETALITAVLPVASKKPTAKAKKAASPVVVDPLEAWWLQFEVGSSALTLWEYLTLLEMLPQSFSRLTVSTAFALWRKLLTIASDLNQLAQMPDAPRGGAAYEADLAQFGFVADPFLDLSLLRNCELPWLAGVVFAGVKGSEKLRLAGSELLEYELYERTDELGAPHADLLPRLPLWLAVTTRVLQTSALEEIPVWDADAAMHYQSLVEKVAPLIQPDGQFAVSRVQVTEPREFVEAVLWASGWPETEAALRSLLVQPRRGKTRLESLVAGITKRRPPLEICIAPVSQSDDASWAVLRSHWGAHADRVTVTHDQPMMNVEFTVQGQPMLDGEWYSEIQIGDRTTPFRGDWYCVCWQTDQDADYIELQLFIRGVVRVERQILLSRTRQFCLIAESLGDIKGESFSYRTKLPLLEGVQATTSATTREVQLTAGGVPARVFPVTLPERHVVSTPGRFGNDFSFQTTGSGAAWYNPILIDWSPARRTAEATWKSLTVAE
ncbi:MAG: hypothetical protein V4719_09875, partial [Planctomycetota bacterium]